MWALDQQRPDPLLARLNLEQNPSSLQAEMVNALSLTEAGKINEAIVAWDILTTRKDSSVQTIAESMKRVLGGPDSWYAGFSDPEKYRFLRYRVALTDSVGFEKMLIQIANEDLRAKAILDRTLLWYERDQISRAAKYYNKLQGLHLSDMKLFADIKYFELRLFAAQGKWPLIQEQIQKGILFGPYREEEHVYCEALSQYPGGDSVKAEVNFIWLAYANSFFDEGIVAAAAYFQKNGDGKYSSYSILSEALQVNGKSIKILKAYIPVARAKGFDQYAISALQTLQTIVSAVEFKDYVNENQLKDLLLP